MINKVDLADEAELGTVVKRIREINQSADILTSSYGDVELTRILGINAFSRHESSAGAAEWLAENSHVHSDDLQAISCEIPGTSVRMRSMRGLQISSTSTAKGWERNTRQRLFERSASTRKFACGNSRPPRGDFVRSAAVGVSSDAAGLARVRSDLWR